MWKTSAAAKAAQLFTQFQHPSSSNSSGTSTIGIFSPVPPVSASWLCGGSHIVAKENAMQPPILKTYRPGMPIGGKVFYIQSKGNHSGRPMIKPIPNCFVAICESQEHLDFWMSICTALWLGKKFEYLIIGSVIPFIRLREAAELLKSMKDLDTD